MDARGTTAGADTRRWSGRTQGSGFMHRSLIWMLSRWPLWIFYGVAALFVVPGYITATPRARRALRQLYRHIGVRYTPAALFRSYYSFARAIIDRFAAYAGRRFDITMIDNEIYRELERGDRGFIMFGSHLGNYELTGYSLELKYKPMNALLFGGEADAVMSGRRRLFGDNNIRIITVTPGTYDHVFAINEALTRGEIVSIPADRTFGSGRALSVMFCGQQAHFPLGPFMLAATRDVPTVAVFMVKTGYRSYKLITSRVSLDSSEYELGTRLRAEALCRRYANLLEQQLMANPYQWYNYFEFWGEGR